MLLSRWNAGWRRRISLIRVMNGTIESAPAQSRRRISYFSECRYSSLVSPAGSFSNSS
jgi:hypothetical protein